MAEQAVVADALAQETAHLVEAHRQPAVVVRSGMQSISFGQGPGIIRRLVFDPPLFPEVFVARPRRHGTVQRLPDGVTTALDGGFLLLRSPGKREGGRAENSQAQ